MSFGIMDQYRLDKLKTEYIQTQQLVKETDGCLHRACQSCGGTGVRKDGSGACIHGISCTCKNCSAYC